MNNLRNKSNGFTLIELSIVLIILGTVAALALPGVFAQIERHRAQEAMNTITMLRSAIESCRVTTTTFANCRSLAAIGMEASPGAHFTYDFSTGTWNADEYKLVATSGVGSMTVTRNAGGITCTGSGKYSGFC